MRILPLFAALVLACTARAELTEEQRRLPLEADAPDPKMTKVILLAGSTSNKKGQHEYFAGCALMADWLRQTPGVWPVLVADGWPQNEAIFTGAKAVVVYADGGATLPFLAPERWARMKQVVESGAGLVMLHQAVDIPKDHADELQAWLGGAFLPDIGCRGHWDMEFTEYPQHPITRGLTSFSAPLDGWLFNLHFAPGVLPLVKGAVPAKARTSADAKANPDRAETVAWSYERPAGGRSFAFTGCDLHRNWTIESQRRLVVNGTLWSAGLEVPEGGAPVEMKEGAIAANMDAKGK